VGNPCTLHCSFFCSHPPSLVLSSFLFFHRQLNAVKSNIASVDHLKEIERLKGLLATAEGTIRTTSAQLHSKESGTNLYVWWCLVDVRCNCLCVRVVSTDCVWVAHQLCRVPLHALLLALVVSPFVTLSPHSCTTELSRTSEKLATIEGLVQSLEERRAAAEAHLHRTQVRDYATICDSMCLSVCRSL
jgi:hypothetical protein